MTINFAIEFISRRMRELGYGDKYVFRLRHFVLTNRQSITVDAHAGEFFLIAADTTSVRVDSDAGLYDRGDSTTNELLYEHHGEITITNKTTALNFIKMIQVIPQNKSIHENNING